MTLLTDASVRRSLDRLQAVPEYQVKLVMANLEEPEGHALYNQCMDFTTKPEGKAPAAHTPYADFISSCIIMGDMQCSKQKKMVIAFMELGGGVLL